MVTLVAKTTANVAGDHGSWRLASDREGSRSVITTVTLRIEGENEQGFHLIKSPDGFFTADDWFLTIDEAFDAAEECFGVRRQDWVDDTAR